MNIRGVCRFRMITPFIAVALLGSGAAAHMATADADIQNGALTSLTAHSGNAGMRVGPTLAAAFATSSTSPPLSLPTGGPSPVLRQIGPQEWETTVLVNDTNPGCSRTIPVGLSVADAGYHLAQSDHPLVAAGLEVPPGPMSYWFLADDERGSEVPGKTIAVEGEQTQSPTTGTAQSLTTETVQSLTFGSSCEVTVAFAGVRQVPETATLVLDQAGASSVIPLTVSRDVTLFYYLGIPAIVGGAMTILLLMLSLLIHLYGWDREKELRRFSREWLGRPVLGSGAWALNDSWATNISTGLVAVATVLSATSAANSLFPGIALDRFAVVNIVAGAIVVAAPVVFGIYYALFTAHNRGPTADATIKLPWNAAITIKVPSGANITMSGDATVQEITENPERAEVRAGCTYQIPPGSTINVQADPRAVLEAVVQHMEEAAEQEAGQTVNQDAAGPLAPVEAVTFADTSDIGVRPGIILDITAPTGTWTVQASDQLTPPAPTGQKKAAVHPPPPLIPWWWPPAPPLTAPDDVHIKYPARVEAHGGAKITVTGTADVTLPRGTVISAPRRREYTLPRERKSLEPQGTNVLVATMGMLVVANIFTMFGIGAELGVAWSLASFSEAVQPGRTFIFIGIAAVALLVFIYAKTATKTMADPQPGSSISAQAGTSFTL
jgi:hypothetical protein